MTTKRLTILVPPGATLENFLAGGWTEEEMVQCGFLELVPDDAPAAVALPTLALAKEAHTVALVEKFRVDTQSTSDEVKAAATAAVKAAEDVLRQAEARAKAEATAMGEMVSAASVAPGHPDMPMDAARSLIDAFYRTSGLREIHHWQDLFMVYASGIYIETSGSALRSQAWKFFEHACGGTPLKSRQVVEILKALEGLTYLSEKTPVPCWLDNPKRELSDLIICQNGAFDLGTGERHDPTPRLFATIRLPVDYTPGAPPPVAWLGFLSSLWPEDAESIATLQEMFGLTLTPIMKFQKIFLLIGPKRSGKGTILRMLRKLLGNDNVAAPALSTLAHQYGMQCLIGKLAALIGDARINARSSEMSIVVERLLSISGEDSPNVERKFLPDWTGGVPTRIVMSANELPHLDDPSGAMASRFVILTLQHSFMGREDLDLEAKLAPEMPAILNWAIEGRRRLLERGRFIQPSSGAASVEQMAELSSSVAKFIRECCTVGPGLQVLKDDLYRAWQTWCARNGERAAHSGLFGRDLHAACSTVKETRPRDPATGKQLPMYAGIKLADTYQPVGAVRA